MNRDDQTNSRCQKGECLDPGVASDLGFEVLAMAEKVSNHISFLYSFFHSSAHSSMSEPESCISLSLVTTMVLKVDLQCRRCYKMVKKILCKFPQIRDQTYDEKANTVTIKVVCCSPEKIRDQIRCKGCRSIKSIEIKPPPPPPPTPKPSPPPTPKPSPPPSRPPTPPPPGFCCTDCSPPLIVFPGFCCTDCYHGHGGGPCYNGGPPPRPCYESCGRPVYDSWCCPCRGYNYCFNEENQKGCSVM
ncbi:protein PYRICULARIA ORYZAE RESISTANCE 21-like [Durio zibethinus]|uniref:Protein PYRICULARIA ORYZAE RESISTANCE 21-like n=1 Tax=Durio zibethinus TaxID=66656 RepID=A0A6P5X4B1_DURZI|nr:protein PYRICULARIA ORYZAE RESISTANCE 21-like [Durio zibethinus]